MEGRLAVTSRKRLLYATIFAIVVLTIPAIADAAVLSKEIEGAGLISGAAGGA